jgi:hypothetical protein
MSEIVNPPSLKIRQLQCELILQSGQFNQGGNVKLVNNNIITSGVSTINATVHTSLSSNFTNSADVIIYGMNESDIAALSTLGYAALKYELNGLNLYANYSDQQKSLCFSGYIVRAWCDFSDPSRPMHFECQTTYQDALGDVTPTSIKGSVGVVDLFSKFASSLGYSLQNNGVSGLLNNPIFTGSPIDQLKKLSKQTSTTCVADKGILKIAPFRYSLSNLELSINSESGLLSYPTIDAWGVKLKIRYDPTLQIGQYIRLETIVPVPKATGRWYVYDMQSTLSNLHEPWYTELKCSYDNVNFG